MPVATKHAVIVILEKVMSDDILLREERESHFIRTFNKLNCQSHYCKAALRGSRKPIKMGIPP